MMWLNINYPVNKSLIFFVNFNDSLFPLWQVTMHELLIPRNPTAVRSNTCILDLCRLSLNLLLLSLDKVMFVFRDALSYNRLVFNQISFGSGHINYGLNVVGNSFLDLLSYRSYLVNITRVLSWIIPYSWLRRPYATERSQIRHWVVCLFHFINLLTTEV